MSVRDLGMWAEYWVVTARSTATGVDVEWAGTDRWGEVADAIRSFCEGIGDLGATPELELPVGHPHRGDGSSASEPGAVNTLRVVELVVAADTDLEEIREPSADERRRGATVQRLPVVARTGSGVSTELAVQAFSFGPEAATRLGGAGPGRPWAAFRAALLQAADERGGGGN